MNKLERIEEMEKQLAALRAEVEQEQKPKQWEPKGGNWVANSWSSKATYHEHRVITSDGDSRETEESARKAAKEITRFKRLLAYRDEFAPDYEFQFGKGNEFILQRVCKTYGVGSDDMYRDNSKVYMPEDVAVELCRKLNSGEVML